MLLGVYDEALLEPLANVLIDLGVTRGMVIYGQDCLDELSTTSATARRSPSSTSSTASRRRWS